MGGMALMTDVYRRDLIDRRTYEAWDAISSGDQDRIAAGNYELLRREQRQIIQDDYDAMRGHHGPVGELFTYAMSTEAENPIPGGRAFRDVYPITVELDPTPPIFGWDPPGPEAHIRLPFPNGNLASFEDRWAWIQNDMFPAYQDLYAKPGAVRAIVSTPVGERAEEFRKLPDLPYPGGD